MRNYIIALLLVALGCAQDKQLLERRLIDQEKSVAISQLAEQIRPSYELSDLCDTEVKERDLTLYIYIDPSERLWDYHDYKDELFDYVKGFFKGQKINCSIEYSNSKLKAFSSSNELGVEILDSKQDIIDRYFELFPPKDEAERKKILGELSGQKGYAATRAGIALMNGGWEEFRHDMSRKDKDWFIEQLYKGRTIKEHVLRSNAALICHEVLHCLGLFHPGDFEPPLVKTMEGEIPNALSYQNPKFSQEYPTGYTISSLQQKIIHSFLAGNNAYKAFVDSNRDLTIFVGDIAKANNLKLMGD